MKTEDYLIHLASQGQHYFTTNDAMRALDSSKVNTWATLIRLEKKGSIATPYRGFHLIVPPEYRRLKCLPPEQFIPDLMRHLKLPYYVGLLSAAQYYGASHQQSQVFQVITPSNRNKIFCGKVKIDFVARKHMALLPTKQFNTSKGYVQVSTPEVTALDLVNYPLHCGGLNNVITVLEELTEHISASALLEFKNSQIATPQLQRLGFFLETIQHNELASSVEKLLKQRVFRTIPLVAKIPNKTLTTSINNRWKIQINETWESDL